MKAILIDPFTRTVSTVTVNDTRADFAEIMDCDKVEATRMPSDTLWIDPEFLSVPEQKFFRVGSATQYIGGRALIVPNEGQEPMTPAEVVAAVSWEDIRFLGLQQIDLGMMEHPEHGSLKLWGTKAVFEAVERQEADPATSAPEMPEEPPAPAPRAAWTIFRDKDTYTAVGFAILPDGTTKTIAELENADLDELREMLPPGLERRERGATDAPEIMESWL